MKKLDPDIEFPPSRTYPAQPVYFYTDPMNEDPRYSNLTEKDKENIDKVLLKISIRS